MAQIRLVMYYTQLVEHYLRMAVRYKTVDRDTPQDWFKFSKAWIEKLPTDDKKLIYFVFDKQFFKTIEGLYCYEKETPMYFKRERLAALERQFAIEGGLIGEEQEQDNNKKRR